MSWIFVIESNDEHSNELLEALAQLESPIQALRFVDSKSFLEWMLKLERHEPELDPPPPAGKFLGLITALEHWAFRDFRLLGKFKTLFCQRGLATSEDEIGVVLTGYEDDIKLRPRFEERSVNNFITKPFDKTLLTQLLQIAFDGRAPVRSFRVHNFAGSFKAEMLKEILITEVTELGFGTISDQAVSPNTIAKYYAGFLSTEQHRSALAKTLSSAPDSIHGTHQIKLRFFALDQQQSFNLQRLARELPAKSVPLAQTSGADDDFTFEFVEHERSSLCAEIKPTAERFFRHPVQTYKNLAELSHAIANPTHSHPTPKVRRFIFIDAANVVGAEVTELSALKKVLGTAKASLFLLSPRIYPESLELELSESCEDIFYAPFNKSYLMKTLKVRWPSLQTKEDLFEWTRPLELKAHASNFVQATEVSEVSVVIEYYRPLPLGSFREFVFWMPNEAEVPTLVAQCNYTAPNPSKKGYLCHFIFFGLKDAERKHIRLWMRHQYIDSKQEA